MVVPVDPIGITASPAAVFQDKLYVFHQNAGANGQLWYNVTPDGTNWYGDQQAPNVGMSASPSVCGL
jgi:hypothetical protein